jgi:hypothetical protein
MSFLRRAGAEIARVIASLSDPAAEAGRALLYSKTVSGVVQLFARASNGDIHQLSGLDKTRLPVLGADPSAEAGYALLYGKDASGVVQVFARASDGTVSQLSGLDLARLSIRNTYTKAQDVAPASLTYGANIAVDASLSNTFTVTLTNTTAQLDNPLNLVNGQTLIFRILQDGVGGRALTFGTNYNFGTEGAPSIVTSIANRLDIITGISDGTKVFCTTLRGFVP